MAKIKKDDTVMVIAGKEKGVTGKVLHVDDGEGQATRVGSRVGDDGRNVRISRRTGKDI